MEQVMDLKELKENVGGRLEVIAKLVEHLQNSLPRTVAELRGGIEARDSERVRRLAHGLKSPLGVFGAHRARQLVRQLEGLGAEGDLSQAPLFMLMLEDEIERIITFFADPDWPGKV